jgi:hypothetical protein
LFWKDNFQTSALKWRFVAWPQKPRLAASSPCKSSHSPL